jgi:hypothetical protein
MGHLPDTFQEKISKKFAYAHNNSDLNEIIGTMQKAATPKRLQIYDSINFQEREFSGAVDCLWNKKFS